MKYIMILPYGESFWDNMCRDMVEAKRMTPYLLNKPCDSPLLNFIRRAHMSYKINQIVHLPCQEIWYPSLLKMMDKDTCVIFTTVVLRMVSTKFLEKIRATGARMALIIVDSLHGSTAHISKALPKILGGVWDAVLSYDINDCKEYGFQYMPGTIYSMLKQVKPASADSDMYFIGMNKAGRNAMIEEIHRKCMEAGVQTDFHCIDYPGVPRKPYMENPPGLYYRKRGIPYEDVVSHVLSTNCILEVVGKGQKVQTARYYEAVCYNKKLLTNNPSVRELSFYDPRYMQYFESVEDIDFSWVKEKAGIDYHYAGEFSPLHILDRLDKMFADEVAGVSERFDVKNKLENRGGNSRVIAYNAAGLNYRKTGLAA